MAAAQHAVALSRRQAPPHVIKGTLAVAAYHACVTAATEIAQQCGADITTAQARSFGTAPQLRCTRAIDYDPRHLNPEARAARAIATASQIFREVVNAAALPTATPASQRALTAVLRTRDAILATLGPAPDSIAASWLRRCHAAADTSLRTHPLAEDELASLREDYEQAQEAATTSLAALRHASGGSWRAWSPLPRNMAAAPRTRTSKGRDACHPAAVRRRSDLRLTGRADCIISHHALAWADHWCRADLTHYTDAVTTDALNAYSDTAPLPPLIPSQLREAAATFKARTQAPDGFHVRHFRMIDGAGLAFFCAIWGSIDLSGVYPAQFARVTVPLFPKKTPLAFAQ